MAYAAWLEELRHATAPLPPFHWPVEFPEVFLASEGENPGFDAIIGNPPFGGKNTVGAGNVKGYLDWLKQAHEQSHGNADLVAHFFRRSFGLLREGGAFGLIATNTIAQGDTRATGLAHVCEHGGEIFKARRRFKWPGLAAVIVSVVHVARTGKVPLPLSSDAVPTPAAKRLDGKPVEKITAFLFHRGGHRDPERLRANAGKSFQGSIVLGMGFTFDDADAKGVASPIAEMDRLIAEDPRNAEAIFPYIGGKEVNANPTHAHHRYVIDFRDYPLGREALGSAWADADKEQRAHWRREGIVPLDYPDPVAADWPDLLRIVEERVKPERAKLTRNAIGRKRAKFWWHYGSPAKELRAAIAGLGRVLVVNCGATPHLALALLPAKMVFANTLAVLASFTHAAFCALQSRPHELWARFFGSSLEDRLRYTPSDCFETFPFPPGWETDPALEGAGRAYHDFRAALMIENDEGLTKTYNRFHDPYEKSPAIQQLRDLHAAMDRAVLAAWGWTDIAAESAFLLDYEIDEEEWGNRKKPYRCRWPDEVHDEVLARLLELNAQRAIKERGRGR